MGTDAPSSRAAVILLDVSGTMSESDHPPVVCTPRPCKLGGDIVIGNSTGQVFGQDVTLTTTAPGATPTLIFDKLDRVFASGGLTEVRLSQDPDTILELEFATPTPGSLVGYTGGPLSPGTEIVDQGIAEQFFVLNLVSGSLTEGIGSPAPVPEPPLLPIVAAVSIGLIVLRSVCCGPVSPARKRPLWRERIGGRVNISKPAAFH
ncbi:MAG TPA: hypothetical protein VFQ82_05545 [Stellaceae bacterium]|nr:hypothetical protein [Stellaceae bacterium]